jgi:hypothetical protein
MFWTYQTYMPAVMLTGGEFFGAPGIKNLPLAHMDGCVGDEGLTRQMS